MPSRKPQATEEEWQELAARLQRLEAESLALAEALAFMPGVMVARTNMAYSIAARIMRLRDRLASDVMLRERKWTKVHLALGRARADPNETKALCVGRRLPEANEPRLRETWDG